MKAKRNGFLISTLLLLALAPACYGPFNATRSLHKWNGEVTESKWGNEAVFLGLAILPVYGLFILGDAVIFNSIEFWGGENPVDGPTSGAAPSEVEVDGRTVPAERSEVAGTAAATGGATGGL